MHTGDEMHKGVTPGPLVRQLAARSAAVARWRGRRACDFTPVTIL